MTLVVGLPIRDDKAWVVSNLAKARGEDGGDVVEGLEGGQELVAALVFIIMIMVMTHDHDDDGDNSEENEDYEDDD